MAVMIDKETKEFRPVTAFLNAEQLSKDIASVNDAARGKFLSILGVSLALLRTQVALGPILPRGIGSVQLIFDRLAFPPSRHISKQSSRPATIDLQRYARDV